MAYRVRTFTHWIRASAGAAQTLPEPAVFVRRVNQLDPAAANANRLINWPVVRGTAPGADEVRFDGTPANPSSTLTFGTALAANDMVLVEYVPVGAM